jgi:hypothetical protein
MPACPRRAVALFPDFLATDALDTTARRTGFVQRTSNMTGTLCLGLVTVGSWRDATTTCAPLAATVPHVVEALPVSPAARSPRLPPKAQAFLQARRHPALARLHARAPVCDAGLLPALPPGSIAASPGLVRPESRHAPVPGSGGSAGTAGAKLPAGWDSTRRLLAQGALTPWNLPEQTSLAPVVACATPGTLWSCALGSLPMPACARLAAAQAAFFRRLQPQASR